MLRLLKVLVPAAFGAAIAFASPVLAHRATKSRERRELIWKEEIRKFKNLEERAGILTETLSGRRWLEDNKSDEVKRDLETLRLAAGRFRRYERVKQSIRHLVSVLEAIYQHKGTFETAEEETHLHKKLEAAYKHLIDNCDLTLEAG